MGKEQVQLPSMQLSSDCNAKHAYGSTLPLAGQTQGGSFKVQSANSSRQGFVFMLEIKIRESLRVKRLVGSRELGMNRIELCILGDFCNDRQRSDSFSHVLVKLG